AAVSILSLASTYGQDTKGGQVLVAPKSIEKPKEEEKKAPLTPPKMTNAILGKPIVYSGYLVELVRAEKKRPLFDLAAPIDSNKDPENVFFRPNQDVAQPIVFFRIKF